MPAPALLPDEDRFDRLEIPLSVPHAGNAVVAMLIAAENLMADWQDDHAEPNIDVNSVALDGTLVTLPAGARLDV